MALLPGSEGSELQRGIGIKAIIQKASFPVQNPPLWTTGMKVWERAPGASGGLPWMPFWLQGDSHWSCPRTLEQNGGGKQASEEGGEERPGFKDENTEVLGSTMSGSGLCTRCEKQV